MLWGFGRNSGCRTSGDHPTPKFVIRVAICLGVVSPVLAEPKHAANPPFRVGIRVGRPDRRADADGVAEDAVDAVVTADVSSADS